MARNVWGWRRWAAWATLAGMTLAGLHALGCAGRKAAPAAPARPAVVVLPPGDPVRSSTTTSGAAPAARPADLGTPVWDNTPPVWDNSRR